MHKSDRRASLAIVDVGLIAAAAALLFSLVGSWHAAPALAQNQPGRGHARGEYTALTGRVPTGSGQMIYVFDALGEEVLAFRWDSGRKVPVVTGWRSLAVDAQAQGLR